MLYLTDRLTLVVRCRNCFEEFDTGEHSSNFAYWHAESKGWLLERTEDPSVERAYCPECIHETREGVTVGGEWVVYCETCENEDAFDTEVEAKKWKRMHQCWEWERPEAYVKIEGPAKRIERERERRQYEADRQRREEARATEKQEMNQLVKIGMIVETARKSWWRRMLLRLAGV